MGAAAAVAAGAGAVACPCRPGSQTSTALPRQATTTAGRLQKDFGGVKTPPRRRGTRNVPTVVPPR